MIKSEFGFKETIEKLRSELNEKVTENIEIKSVEENEKILAMSRKLDNILLEYIKNKF